MAISEIVIPQNVRIIDDDAFEYCEKLSKVSMSEGLEVIGKDAFNRCTSLKEITIPKSVRNIRESAIQGNSGNLTIYGYENTMAQTFAEDNEILFKAIQDEAITTTTTTTITTTAPASTTTTTTLTSVDEPALGDVNSDGIINEVDASKILVLYAGLSSGEAEATDKDFAACDINGDKLINAVDASLVLAYYASLAQSPDLTLEAFLERK